MDGFLLAPSYRDGANPVKKHRGKLAQP
jgi:hypothetical protein